MSPREGSALRVRDRGVLVAQGGAEAGRGRGVPVVPRRVVPPETVGGGKLSATPDAVRVSASAPGGFPGAVRRGGPSGAGVGSGALGEAVDRRDEGACEREQAQGDELRPDAGRGTAPIDGCARRTRLTRPRTRAWARRFGAMICRRSCTGGKRVWQRFRRRRRVWKQSNGRQTTRGVGSRVRTGTRRAVGRTSGRMASRTRRRRALHGP